MVCPAAIAGYPVNAGRWKLTYMFGIWPTPIGRGVPWQFPGDERKIPNIYWTFDGRPLQLVDGRRYVRIGVNQNDKGQWDVRFPIIADRIEDESVGVAGGFVYPHRGLLERRNDLENARDAFERNVNWSSGAYMPGRNELHADGERATILFTRTPDPHLPGY